jgi:tetratricopeptide (TPR) repeat protein
MRPPVSAQPATGNPLVRAAALTLLSLFAAVQISAQNQPSPTSARERMHQSDQWTEIQKHLPDPATASPQALEQQADILRARKFPADAMDFYNYALTRGGNPPVLMNKIGLAELEMGNIQLGRVYFQRVVKISRKDASAWNNLGAADFMDGKQNSAISDYKRAVKLDKHQAVFHANLASAYFTTKDYHGARREIAAALELDPQVFENEGTGGISAHVLSSEDRARFSFEMAKMYARSNMEDAMLHSLGSAAEAGMDVQVEMRHDPYLAKFEMDPRVLVLVRNARMLRATQPARVSLSGTPDQGGAKPVME